MAGGSFDLQGNIMPGFSKPMQAFLFFEMRASANTRKWLADFVSSITTQQEVEEFRKAFRAWKANRVGPQPTATWRNVGFAATGIAKLGFDPDGLMSQAFAEGSASRAHLVDGPTDGHDPANPQNWLINGAAGTADMMIHLAADTEGDLVGAIRHVSSTVPPSMRLIHYDVGNKLAGSMEGKEHFGYKDGISQPDAIGPVRPGEWNNKIDPSDLFIADGKKALPLWARGATFAVFARLAQDVRAFRKACSEAAESISRDHRVENLTPAGIGARLMGRWTSGAPLELSPDTDAPDLGANDELNNDFQYGNDPWGRKCPIDSHARQAFSRDDKTGRGQPRRILRRGIPFGTPYPSAGGRGLLFLSFQASIEQQFEGRLGADQDVWQQLSAGPEPLFGLRERPFTLSLRRGPGMHQDVTVRIKERFVTTTGAAYMVYPSISGMQILARGP